VTRIGERRNGYGILVGKNMKEETYLKDLGVDGRLTFKLLVRK
jgi:hypothetical protein